MCIIPAVSTGIHHSILGTLVQPQKKLKTSMQQPIAQQHIYTNCKKDGSSKLYMYMLMCIHPLLAAFGRDNCSHERKLSLDYVSLHFSLPTPEWMAVLVPGLRHLSFPLGNIFLSLRRKRLFPSKLNARCNIFSMRSFGGFDPCARLEEACL